jgi:protein gp37
MGDVGEDHPVVLAQLPRLWRLIEATPHLIWMLLTKRPENMASRVPASWLHAGWPRNVWLGTSSGTQVYARLRVPLLMAVPGVHTLFVSVEPQLAPVDLTSIEPLSHRRVDALLKLTHPEADDRCHACDAYSEAWSSGSALSEPLRDGRRWWVIGGGESGGRARRCETDWLASLVEQGRRTQTRTFIKQLGSQLSRHYRLPGKGEDWSHWPDELASLRVREWPDGSRLDPHEPLILFEKQRRHAGKAIAPPERVGQTAVPD